MTNIPNLFYGICDIYYLSQTMLSYMEDAGNKCSQTTLFDHLFRTWLCDHRQKYSDPGTVSKLFNAQLRFNDNILTDLKSTYRSSFASDIRNNIFPVIPNHTQMLEEICTFLNWDMTHAKTHNPGKFRTYTELIASHFHSYFLVDAFEWAKATADWEAALLADILLFVMEDNFYYRESDDKIPHIPLESTNPPINSAPPPETPFFGRTDELKTLRRLLEEKKYVFVSGFAGIGKSELIKKYIAEMRSLYNRILFVKYSGSLENDLRSLAATLNHSISFSGMEIPPYWARLQMQLALKNDTSAVEPLKVLSEDDLIVIDNLDALPFENSVAGERSQDSRNRNLYGAEPLLTDLLDLPCKILITTRCDYSQKYLGYSDHCLNLSSLDPQTLLLFFQGSDFCSPKEKPLLRKIIGCLENNTFLVKLAERLLSTGHSSVQEIWNQLQKSPLNVNNDTRIAFRHWNTCRYDTFGQHIRLLLSLFELSDMSENILINLSLMPVDGISQNLFEHWIGLNSHQDTDLLCGMSLIRKFSKYKTSYLYVPRIITEIYKDDGKLTIESAHVLLTSLNSICIHHLGQEEKEKECLACSDAICSVCSNIYRIPDSPEMQKLYIQFINDAIPFQNLHNKRNNLEILLEEQDILSCALNHYEDHFLYHINQRLFFPKKQDCPTEMIHDTTSMIWDFFYAFPDAIKDHDLILLIYSAALACFKASKDRRKASMLTYILDHAKNYPNSKYVRLFCYPICLYLGRKKLLKTNFSISLPESDKPLPLPSDSSSQKNF